MSSQQIAISHICRIVIGGFQSLRDRVEIPLAPMTFLFGPNSAGKSAVFDAMRLLHAITAISQTKETIAYINTTLLRDCHVGSTKSLRDIQIGVEISELPTRIPDCLDTRREHAHPGRSAADEIWERLQGSRIFVEVRGA